MALENFDPEGFMGLADEELGNERNAFSAALAGVASGLIKVPEGVVSLGAELIDLGAGTDLATDVEVFFDKLNPFEEIAQEKAAGRLTEALVQIGIPGSIGFSVARKMATKALSGKKANKYLDLKRPDLLKGAGKADELNKAARKKRFAAAVAGGAAGETLVADVESIGSIGDALGGPTDLDDEALADSSQDAGRKLLNRVKFGGESLFITPIVYGIGRGIKAAAATGKNIEFSNSKLDQFFNKIFSAVRARGAKPQKIFEEKMAEKGATMADTNEAMKLVKEFDKPLNKMFPTIKTTFNQSTGKEKAEILETLNDAMFSGDLTKGIKDDVVMDLTEKLKIKGLKRPEINQLFGTLGKAREAFTTLISTATKLGGDMKNITPLKSIMGQRVKDYLGGTYRIFEDKPILPFVRYTPTGDAYKNARELFIRYAAKSGKPFASVNQVDEQLNRLIDTAIAAKKPNSLPFFKYTSRTAEADDTLTKKFFKQVLVKDAEGKVLTGKRRTSALRGAGKKGDIIEPIGKGSKVFREFFGEMSDPRFSLYNGMTRLSTVARKNQMFKRLDDQDYFRKQAVREIEQAGGVVAPGTKGFFFGTRNLAEDALPNQEIVKLDDYVANAFKDDYAVNPLAGKYTSKAIADGLSESGKILKFLFEPRKDATGVEKLATWGYRNLILFPKAASQVAKTILAPVTHFRNIFSATGFSAANGIFFENPAVVAKAFNEALKTVEPGAGIKKFASKYTPYKYSEKEFQEAYRKFLRLGVVNSQTNVNDFKNILGDLGYGGNLNLEKPLQSMGRKLLGSAGRGAKAVMKGAEDLYTAEDDLFKIANYAVERYRLKNAYSRAGREFTEDMLDNEAADIVRNTVPNYAYVSDTVRALRRLPLGTFMSFPSEILRTTTNIGQRAIREIKDPALRNIGIKRLLGMTTVLAAAPYGIQKGFQSLYDVTNDELEAIKRYLPKWSKNSTILPIRDEDTGELKYIDFSHGNAYDVAIRPLQTLLNNIQNGIEDEEVLMKGLLTGMAEAAGELASPFISESIYTEALTDLTLRNGVTDDGRALYTDQTPGGDKIKIGIDHLAQSMLPFSYPQLTRLYQAAMDKPSKRGEFFELPDELLGFAGYRAVKLDPIRSMGFKIAQYQRGIRESRGLFTGGGLGDSLLSGGPKTPVEVIDRYIKANQAKFNVQKEMLKDLKAADLLNADEDEISREFRERQLRGDYNDIINDRFDPYYPSRNIRKEFAEIADRIGEENPFEEVEDILQDIRDDLRDLSLEDNYDIDITTYIDDDMFSAGIQTPPLPGDVTSAMPNPQVIQTAQANLNNVPNNGGLTSVENALLSEEEKQIRLRQRGIIT